MKALTSGLCTLMLASAMPALPEPPAPPASEAQLTRQEGTLELRDATGAALAVRSLPASLPAGTRLTTGRDSEATVTLPDGTNVDIGADTTVLLTDPQRPSGSRLFLRDGTVHEVDPRSRLLLAWPKSGQTAVSDAPDFRIEIPSNAPVCAKAPQPAPLAPPWADSASEPQIPGRSDLRDAPAPQAEPAGVIDIEINGDEPPKVQRR